MDSIKDLWSGQIIPMCKNILDITATMVPGITKDSKDVKKGSTGSASTDCICPQKAGGPAGSRTTTVVHEFLTPTGLNMIRIAGISGALAVGLGAYGAHVIMISNNIPEEQKNSYRTASMYHFIGTFGLVAASLGRHPLMTGALMATGTVLFSGSCYIHAITGDSSIKKLAPIGGTTLILAWLSLVL